MIRSCYLIFIISLASCQNKDFKESQNVINVIVGDIPSSDSDSIVVSEDSFSDWDSLPIFKDCNLEWFVIAQKQSMSVINNEVNVGDLLSEEDLDKICSIVADSSPYKFPSSFFPSNVIINSQQELDVKYNYYQENLLDEKDKLNLNVELEGFQDYYRFSNPIFLQDYKYAFIYYSKVGKLSGFSNLLILEKKGENWECVVGIVLSRYG